MVTPGFGNRPSTFARRRAFPFYGEQGMVAAAHPLAVDAGMFIMHSGGNAFDVAVATAIAASVVMPEMCGLGGESFALYSVQGGVPQSLQATGRSARGASYELMKQLGGNHMPYTGPHSIAVPGMVDSYFSLLETFGTMSFAQVAEPAISLARNGFVLQTLGARAIAEHASILAKDPAASAIFLDHGEPRLPGTRLLQSDLADTLEQIGREGSASFYTGEIAQRMIGYLQSVGSTFDHADFADYSTEHAAPYAVTYRGHTVFQTPFPSQGIVMLEALNIVEHAELDDPLSADAIHLMTEAKKLAFADRLAALGEGGRNPVNTLLSKRFAAERFARIDMDQAMDATDAGEFSEGDTTYLCAADENGNMVSFIQSASSAFGSCVVAGDTGVLMNNRAGRGFSLQPGHPNVYAPGKKSMHTLNCYLITDQQQQPVVVGGTIGGDAQPQTSMQAVIGMIDAGFDVQTAIEQPRWISWPSTDPATIDNAFELRMEDRVDQTVREELAARGHNVVLQPAWGGGGMAQIIARDPESGLLIGGSDARAEGTVLGR